MKFRGRNDAQFGLSFAVVFVEELVGKIVGPSEDEVRVEGAEFSKIYGIQLCDVRIRGGLDNLEEARREPQGHVRVGANVGMHGGAYSCPVKDKSIPYATVF